jgi:hypothetical protein
MDDVHLTDRQLAVADRARSTSLFLEGVAGTGKTTAAVARLLRMLQDGISADAILVLLPQRTLATPYTTALRGPGVPPGGEVTVVTMGGLAQRMVELYWPQVAEQAGFAAPRRPPVFLTLETAQYYMARLVRPLLDDGYFESVKIDRNRLYSQILDNLNKAALVGFPHTEIASRLKAAWVGEPAQARVYDEAQECAERFRAHCLANNLLDFSLQYEVFARHLWPLPACRGYLTGRYTHLIADNIEEDTPVAHDILAEWLPSCRSALLVFDQGAGNRRFLGADPASADRLKALCAEHIVLAEPFVASPDVQALVDRLGRALGRRTPSTDRTRTSAEERGQEEETVSERFTDAAGASPAPRAALAFTAHRYHPEMLAWVGNEIASLVNEQGVPPSEITVLAPFLTGALRFSLAHELTGRGVPFRSHRPSRSLREEPTTQCLLTLAALCHPGWGIAPTRFDVAHALMLAIDDLDLVRAQLLADIAYRDRGGAPMLLPFVDIEPAMQERITFLLGGRYEGLRTWVAAHVDDGQQTTDRRPLFGASRRSAVGGRRSSLDHFLSRLFGELLSQPGYGFHRNYDAGEITANLIESVRKFRQVMLPDSGQSSVVSGQSSAVGGQSSAVGGQPLAVGGQPLDLGREYVQMVQDGVVAAQYVRSWQRQPKDAVLLAPAYTFLMTNRPVSYQFWLDVGGTGWWERLSQPLTHPYVLSRRWAENGGLWTDADEYAARQDALTALALGLLRRCRVKVYLGLSELGAQGSEQRGPLLQAVQRVLRSA